MRVISIQTDVQYRQAKVMALLDASGPSLRGLLVRLTQCEAAVGDLMQDLFIRLYESDSFARSEEGFAFAWRVATNLAFDWRRKQRRHPVPTTTVTTRQEPLERTQRREEIAQLLDVIESLNEPGRTVIIMRHIEQQSYETMAQHLGKNVGHLRSICSKALQQLRWTLERSDVTSGQGGVS